MDRATDVAKRSTTEELQKMAEAVVSECKSSSYRPACYDEKVPLLMNRVSMEEAFQVTRIVQELDPSYVYCHVLGHKLSAKETARDPAKWREVVARCPSGLCSNGCIHGAFQEKFRAESLPQAKIEDLKPELETICEDRASYHPTGLEKGTCYHALGHLAMYVTAGDVPKSLSLCDEIALKSDGRDYRELCYDGAFMQIFQPLEPEDKALVSGKQPKTEDLPAYCNSFGETRRSPCWSESWPLKWDEIKTPAGLVKHCGFLTQIQEENRCYLSLFYVITAQFNFDEVRMSDYCRGLPNTRRGQCFANAASRMIETDWRNIRKAAHLCQTAETSGVAKPCYDELAFYAGYNFRPGSEEQVSLCQSLPSPWHEKCPMSASGQNLTPSAP